MTLSNALITHLQLFVCICCNFSKSTKHDVKLSAKEHISDAFCWGGRSMKSNLGKKKYLFDKIDYKNAT